MGARFHLWWQKIRKPLEIAVVITLPVIVVVLFVLIILGYIFHWDWTGLFGYNNVLTATEITASPQKITKTVAYQPGKTLWDWLQLLIIPAVLAVGGYLFNLAVSHTEQQNTTDNQREAALQAYIDKISELLLHEHLGESPGNHQIETIARARTATVLCALDPIRRGSLIRFLSQAGILVKCTEKEKAMAGLDLHEADLSRLNLSSTNLSAANLSGAYLSETDLREARLLYADLSRASLWGADLSGADLAGADLSRAFLSGAIVTHKQLKEAESLKGAIMPDGSIHP